MTRPPSCGESFARRRAFTVPAREFVTVDSTVPRSTVATSTGTGAGANTVHRSTKIATTTAQTTRSGVR
jgi:hypothetical protein